jgi:hypothetical protein
VKANFLQELAFLLATDSVAYADYARSILLMEAEAEVAKARITFATKEHRRMLEQELQSWQNRKGVKR